MVITIVFTIPGAVRPFSVLRKSLVDNHRSEKKNVNSCKSKQTPMTGTSKKVDTVYTDAQILTFSLSWKFSLSWM